MIIKIPPSLFCYDDLWKDNISLYYLILLNLSTTFSIDITFPLDVIKYILIIYLKYEIQHIPIHLRCPCDLISCQRKWLKLKVNKTDLSPLTMPTFYIKEGHCFTKNCHNICEDANYPRRCNYCMNTRRI